MFERLFEFWLDFCWDVLRIRGFLFNAVVYIPHQLFLYEIKSKHGSIDGYLEFRFQEEEKERLAKHRKRFRNLGLK